MMRQPANPRLTRRSSNAASSLTRSSSRMTQQSTGRYSFTYDRLHDYDSRGSALEDPRPQATKRARSSAHDEWDFSQAPSSHHDSRASPASHPHDVDAELSQTTSAHHTNLNLSDLAASSPALAAVAANAFHTPTTIVVKIWINYDPIAQEFYHHPTDRRAVSCGQVVLSPRQRSHIEALLRDQNRGFQRVRLDIGTPFRPLAHVFVEVMLPEPMLPPGRQRQQYDQVRSRPWLATSIVAAEVAQRREHLTRKLCDFLSSGHQMIRGEVPADAGGGCEILLEDLDRWAGYFLHRQARAQAPKRDESLRRYHQTKATWGFGSL